MNYKRFPERKINWILGSPFIYVMIFPLFILDFFAEIYHQVCFRLYGIDLVNRSKYIQIDRHKLSYLDAIDKVNCAYCGYATGLLAYVTEISAQTEKYWCGIKHAANNSFIPPAHHSEFIEYGDEESLNEIENQDSKCKIGNS